ncbi:type IV secretory system conjugative DNA transfer family protein, partial [Rhodococcus sp. NPDC058514]
MRRDRPGASSDKDMMALAWIAVLIPVSFLPVIAYYYGGGEDAGWNPIGLMLSVGMGKHAWPGAATAVLVLELLVIAAVAGGGWWALRKTGVIDKRDEKKAERRLDKLASTMADPREVEETNPREQVATTERIAPAISQSHPGHRGILMGRTVNGNRELRMPWEWVCVAIAGARMGKSQALAIPAIGYAPGALIATSNKKDIYTHTLYLRKQMGRVWLFDLQGVTTGNPRERATFWFNPLRQVFDLPSAKVVGDYFVSAATDDNAKVDAYFDGNARDLFGSYILAAALAGGDMRHVVEWLTNTQSQIPPVILEQFGYPDLANTMRGKQQI